MTMCYLDWCERYGKNPKVQESRKLFSVYARTGRIKIPNYKDLAEEAKSILESLLDAKTEHEIIHERAKAAMFLARYEDSTR